MKITWGLRLEVLEEHIRYQGFEITELDYYYDDCPTSSTIIPDPELKLRPKATEFSENT